MILFKHFFFLNLIYSLFFLGNFLFIFEQTELITDMLTQDIGPGLNSGGYESMVPVVFFFLELRVMVSGGGLGGGRKNAPRRTKVGLF